MPDLSSGTAAPSSPAADERLTLPFAGSRGREAPTLAEIQELADQRAPRPVTVSDPTWLANFRCHRRSASAYRRGRVLLAGDAVHIHTPDGGQGMNTGITDAHNLGWKLALVASGRAPDALLDSYGTEPAARPGPASTCPTSRSKRAARPPPCTASCAQVGTCW